MHAVAISIDKLYDLQNIDTIEYSDKIYYNTTSLAHEICVQIVKMEAVANESCSGYSTRVIQYKLATQFRNFHFIYLVQATYSVTSCVGMAVRFTG